MAFPREQQEAQGLLPALQIGALPVALMGSSASVTWWVGGELLVGTACFRAWEVLREQIIEKTSQLSTFIPHLCSCICFPYDLDIYKVKFVTEQPFVMDWIVKSVLFLDPSWPSL